ncbi:aminotransferase class III-fold pyridoxal phosphate-dependent enzyme [Alphaproteobacteria bacterium]|nr:aminotransferase class III-fold pyridoxal phosphate-dependent enzyme [Alphaproteobacteria bacterium]
MIDKRKKIICIIQARLNSKRLPKKVLVDIAGKSCLQRVIERVKASKLINEIWLATTFLKEDKILEQTCNKLKIKFFQGSNLNVLSRFYKILKITKAQSIVRITADCPLIDAKVIDQVIRKFQKEKCDYLSNTVNRTFPDGLDVEIFSSAALKKTYLEAKHPFLKEHVTPYMHGKVPKGIQSGPFTAKQFLNEIDYSNIRITLDRPEDLVLIRKVFSNLKDFCSWQEVIDFIKKNPSLKKINNHIKTNEGSKISMSLIKKNKTFTKSNILFKKAIKVIPTASQTFSKSYMQWPLNISPLFLKSGKGCEITDVDNNKYIDYLLALMPIIIGYANKEIDQAVYSQARKGSILSLSHPKEIELSEKLIKIIPYAEMVKFSKNGSDVLSAAVRLARATTQRDYIAVSGYHGWHDWYIGTTSRNYGIPKAVRSLTKKFNFNDVNSLEKTLGKNKEKFAAIVLEPDTFDKPRIDFLKEVRKICDKHGIIMIYDEIICGFRTMLGGAAKKYKVFPDLGCFGKAMANGYPLAALVGKKKIMEKLGQVFVSGTFAGELLSIEACLKTIEILKRDNVIDNLIELGSYLKAELNKKLEEKKLIDEVTFEGNDWWPRLNIKNTKIDKNLFTSLLRQELISNGLFLGASLNLCASHNKDNVKRKTIKKFSKSIDSFNDIKLSKNPGSFLRGNMLESVFKVR